MSLEQYIEQTILPQYDAFDGGHKRDHAQMVIDESRKLAREHGADEQMAYVIAAYHDLGLRFDRETHHLHSGEILMADQTLRRWFTEEQLQVMREAVEDHRASSKRPPRSLYGAIVAEADRQINPTLVIHRTMAYSQKLFPDGDFETLYARSKEHLLEKYAEGGYMRLWLNSERNVRSLEELRAIIRDEDRLRTLCQEWYNAHDSGTGYTEEQIRDIVAAQRKFFRTGETLPVQWRIKQLKRLKEAVIAHQQEFMDALAADLGRSELEAYLCDVGPIIVEINEMLSGLRRWARPERHWSGLMCFPSLITKVYKMPYGVSLVISPFNFPILLTIGVVAAAMCGGNTVVIKSSSKSAACTAVLKKFFAEVFPPEYITLIDGGHDVADMCLAQRFDKIFYTGSPAVGKHVLAEAAKHLTPVALELGGETGNWCVVRKDADLKDAARKIAFFKLTNAGQICININQIAVAEEVADAFIAELKAAFVAQIGEHAEHNPEYPKLITDAAYDKCAKQADAYRERIVFGGTGDRETRRYAPTLIYPVDINEPIVQHELFCPLLPIVPFKDAEADALMDIIAEREHPLAMYLFTSNIRWANRVMQTQQFGGGCINEVCIHMMVKGVPFNGTGHSGMGAYHGEWGFREFTHPQTVLRGHTLFNLPLREHPYSGKAGRKKMSLLRLFER